MSEGSIAVAAPSTGGSTQGNTGSQPGGSSSQGSETPSSGSSSASQSSTGSNPLAGGSKNASAPEYFDVKVNGKVVRMTRQEAIDHASMSYAANDRFNEAKKLKQEVDKIISNAKTNPIQALMDPALGLSKEQIRDAFEKWYHQEFIEPETLTEDQRKLRDAETRLQKYEEEEKLKKQQAETEEQEKLTQQQREYLQNQIVEAIEASGLPKTKFIASRMAFYMRQNLMNGWDAPQEMIIRQVKNERQAIMSDLISHSDGASLIELLGEEVVNKIRQHDLKQLRERRQMPAPGMPGSRSNEVIPEKISMSEVTRNLRNMRMGRF